METEARRKTASGEAARRPGRSSQPAVDVLEGRQLLSTMGMTSGTAGLSSFGHVRGLHGFRGHLGAAGNFAGVTRMINRGFGGAQLATPVQTTQAAPVGGATSTTSNPPITTTAVATTDSSAATTNSAPVSTTTTTATAPTNAAAINGAPTPSTLNGPGGAPWIDGTFSSSTGDRFSGNPGPMYASFGGPTGGGFGADGGPVYANSAEIKDSGFGINRGPIYANFGGPVGGGFGGNGGSGTGTSTFLSKGSQGQDFGGFGAMTAQVPAGFAGIFGKGSGGPVGSTGSNAPNTQTVQDFKKLQTDTQAIHDKSEVTPKELAAVRNDFQKIATGATSQPDQTKVTTLTTDLAAVGDQLPNSAQTQQLTTDFTAVAKSAGVTDQTLIDQTIQDVQTVITSTNLTSDDLATLAADRLAIGKDLGTSSGGTNAGNGTPTDAGFGGVLRMTLAPALRQVNFNVSTAGSSTTTTTASTTAPSATSTSTST